MVEKVSLKWMLCDLEKSVCPSFCPLEGCSYTLNYSGPFLLLWTQRCWMNEWIWFPYLVTSCVSPHPFMATIENEYSENETIGSCLCATSGEEWKHGGLQAIANSRWGPLSGRWSSETSVHMHRHVLIGSQVHVYGRYWKYSTIGILLMSMFRSTQYGCVPTHVLQLLGHTCQLREVRVDLQDEGQMGRQGGLPKRLLPEFQRERGSGAAWTMAVMIDTEELGQQKTGDFLRAGST